MLSGEPVVVWIKRDDGSRVGWVVEQPPGAGLSEAGQMRRVMVSNADFRGITQRGEFKHQLKTRMNTIYEELLAIWEEEHPEAAR